MALPNVHAAAAALLALVEAEATAEGVTLPERRYVASGAAAEIAWDCEQVVVALVQLGEALAGLSQGGGGQRPAGAMFAPGGFVHLPSAQLQAQIVRCAPTPTPRGAAPPVAELAASGQVALTDAALLHRVRCAWAVTPPGAPTDVLLGQVIPSGPAGGYYGTTLTVTVTVTADVPDPEP